MQQTGWSNKGERAEMGLHPSIRSLLAANTGFTTGNVTSQPKRTLSLSTSSSHLPSPLEFQTLRAHNLEGSKSLCLGAGRGGWFDLFSLPGLVLEPGATCLPQHLRGALTPRHSRPGWLNRLQGDTCAVCWVALHRGARAGALGLINIKSFMMVLSSP